MGAGKPMRCGTLYVAVDEKGEDERGRLEVKKNLFQDFPVCRFPGYANQKHQHNRGNIENEESRDPNTQTNERNNQTHTKK